MTYDVIDTRDLVQELDDLEAPALPTPTGEYGEIVREGLREAFPWIPEHVIDDSTPLDEEDQERVLAINALFSELVDYAEDTPEDGVFLIPEYSFTSYAEDLADDLGMVPADEWPVRHIDWEAAADALAQDYTEVEFAGVTYLYR